MQAYSPAALRRLVKLARGQFDTILIDTGPVPGSLEASVVVPEVDGVKYLVSTRGETEWVKNVRAIPDVTVGKQKYVATEIPVEQRAPVLAVYRPLAGKVVEGYWRQLPDDADHPVFALTPKA